MYMYMHDKSLLQWSVIYILEEMWKFFEIILTPDLMTYLKVTLKSKTAYEKLL